MELTDFRRGLGRWLDDNAATLGAGVPFANAVADRLSRQREVQQRLYDEDWMRFGWPERVGGLGGSVLCRAVLGEELTSRGIVHTTTWSMHEVLGPAVVEYADPTLVAEVFPRLLCGEETWCQGFSEPEAGSDLGSLRTTATQTADGDSWVINGEKLWTSFAHHAARCVVLARTGPAGSGSAGISAFLVDMDSPGVVVRPLATMAGVDEFCSTSFVDVVVPGGRLVGGVGDGWKTTAFILACERGPIFWQRASWLARHLELLLPHASDHRTHALVGEAFQALWAFRARSLSTLRAMEGGSLPGPEASIDKILIASAEQTVFELAKEVLSGDLELSDSTEAEMWRSEWAYSRAATIYGGTSEIQKDIVSSRLLGLPRGA
ncbi:MAG TPA: acyl-CoA dehydrogenase family protein [Mycobacteriales bacterium]|jgi:alkylation response protein AidB-like acyl-CoA dehydrogenase|nr:acyl-CoA dehydrogenase family protein [Mycobacteriales bacterium]